MKICKYCRTKYDDNLACCPNCAGTKVITEQELAEEEALVQREIEYRERANAVPGIKKKRLIGILSAAVICIVAVIALVSYNANKPLSNGMTKDESEEVLATGMTYFNNGDYESAIECLQQLPSDSKQYEEAQELIRQSKDSYCNEIISRVDYYISVEDFDNAYELIEQAQNMLLDSIELKQAEDRVYESYRSAVIEHADAYVAAEQYEVAIEYLKGKQEKFPNDSIFQETYDNTVKTYNNLVSSQAIQEAGTYVESNDYENGIKVLRTASEQIGQNDELSATLSVYENTYKENVMSQIDTVYSQNGYEAVVALLEQAKGILPEDSDIAEEYRLWESRRPVLLTEMDIYSGNAAINPSNYNKDNYGKIYSNSLCLSNAVEYYIGKEYTIFNATVYVTNAAKDFEYSDYRVKYWDSMTISIYGDDELLYTKTGFNPKDKPLDFSVDVSNVEFLKITYAEQFYGFTLVAFGDLTLGW